MKRRKQRKYRSSRSVSRKSSMAWELWSREGRESYFIEVFSDKGNAIRRMRRLKNHHPYASYFIKHRSSARRRHFERRR